MSQNCGSFYWFFSSGSFFFLPTPAEKRAFSQLHAVISAEDMDFTADERDRYRTLQHMDITVDGRDHLKTSLLQILKILAYCRLSQLNANAKRLQFFYSSVVSCRCNSCCSVN